MAKSEEVDVKKKEERKDANMEAKLNTFGYGLFVFCIAIAIAGFIILMGRLFSGSDIPNIPLRPGLSVQDILDR